MASPTSRSIWSRCFASARARVLRASVFPMNVLYEEEGALKVGSVLADNVTSLQVEAPHGKRSKIKAASVLLRFDDVGINEFLPQAQRLADEIDLDFLWECS